MMLIKEFVFHIIAPYGVRFNTIRYWIKAKEQFVFIIFKKRNINHL